ncbi:hypothetical protein [Algoriphagus sp. AGSA1]|nr:hypothetical protein [Algoriphagus sp. AGSA1]
MALVVVQDIPGDFRGGKSYLAQAHRADMEKGRGGYDQRLVHV